MPLSYGDRELTRLVAANRVDYMLVRLASLAEANPRIGIPVAILVGGFLIEGRLEGDSQFGAHVDDELERAADVATIRLLDDAGNELHLSEPEQSELREAVRTQLRERFSFRKEAERLAESARSAHDEAVEKSGGGSVTLSKLPNTLARRYLMTRPPKPTISLGDARIVAPRDAASEIGWIRVQISEVAAWWVAVPEGRSL